MNSLFLPRPVKIAGASIPPCRILKQSSTSDATLVEKATDPADIFCGVSFNATKYPPGSTEDNGYLQVAGFAVPYYGQGDICFVEAGAAITNLTLPLTTDSVGRAVSTSARTGSENTNVSTIGFPLKAAAAAGELIPVQIDLKFFPRVA